MKGRRAALGALLLVMAAGAAPAAEETLRARGNEPSWLMTLSGGALTFEAPGQGLTFKAPSFRREIVDGHPHVIATEGGRTLEAKITERMCADTMSGMPFPVGIEVNLAGQRFSGCGGEIMTAVEGGWRVIRLGDAMLPDGVTVTMVVERDGKVSGRSGCNRFSGAYTLTGEGLSFGNMAVTRMACPPPMMETEQRFLDMLKKISRATPGENAQLRLMAGDDQALVLDRAD